MTPQTPHILIADDDFEVLERYRLLLGVSDEDLACEELERLDDFLASLGKECEPEKQVLWRAELVEQGFDALHVAAEAKQRGDPVTHAFLDMRMPPGMDGLQTAVRLREIDSSIEIIFVSAYIDYTDEEMDRVLGRAHWHFLQKPFNSEQILRLLPNGRDNTV